MTTAVPCSFSLRGCSWAGTHGRLPFPERARAGPAALPSLDERQRLRDTQRSREKERESERRREMKIDS